MRSLLVLSSKIFALVVVLVVSLALFVRLLGLTAMGALLVYTGVCVAIGKYLKHRSDADPIPTEDAPEAVDYPDDLAIAELVGAQELERRALIDENRELREELSEFVPSASHFRAATRCADGQSLYLFDLTYVRAKHFTDWNTASQFVQRFKTEALASHVAQDNINRAQGRRTIA